MKSGIRHGIQAVVVAAAVLMAGAAGAQDKPDRSAGKVVGDWWITMKIHSQFIPEDALDGSNIDVDTKNGVVTLTGTVASEAGRTRAVALAKATDGVKNVTDQLKIAVASSAVGTAGAKATETAKSTGRKVNDGWIKSKIYSQYLTENALDDSHINIDVAQGVVTLKGTVQSAAGKDRAVAIAKGTDGVKSVKDALKVTAKSR